ncbi:MAG: hypothetical protein IPO21_10085 [Bacteroidales bacterium]|nr:hypothetical protein [Bacteroidales bacterium]
MPPSPDFTFEAFTGDQSVYFRNKSTKTPITDGEYRRDLSVDYYWNFNYPDDPEYTHQKENRILQTDKEELSVWLL